MATQEPRRSPLSQRTLATILVLVGLLLVGMFGLRAFRSFTGIRQRGLGAGPAGVEQIRGWMTLPHVADIYDVPVEEIFAELGLPQAGNEQLSLEEISKQYEIRPGAMRRAIEEVVRRHQPAPPGPPGPPEPPPPSGGGQP